MGEKIKILRKIWGADTSDIETGTEKRYTQMEAEQGSVLQSVDKRRGEFRGKNCKNADRF